MSFKNENLHRCLFLWGALSENKLEPRQCPFNETYNHMKSHRQTMTIWILIVTNNIKLSLLLVEKPQMYSHQGSWNTKD